MQIKTTILALAASLGACLGAAMPAISHAASFDCKKAVTLVETTICADPQLSKADEELAAVYRELVARKPEHKGMQRLWLRTVRDRCTDAACLRKAYDERDIELRISLEPDDDELEAAQRARR